LSDALLSEGDSTFLTAFLRPEKTNLPFKSQIVATRTEGLSASIFFTAASTSMKNIIKQYVIKVSA
jgi:hypothetical protein